MEAFVSALMNVLVPSLVSGVTAAVVCWWRTHKAMDDGLRSLLWRELKQIHKQAFEDGGLSIDDREHGESVYKAYHSRGGNGTGTKLFNEFMETPIIY